MFHKTADETNALLDMWVRVLSQAEHTQALLHDPEWEGKGWVRIFLSKSMFRKLIQKKDQLYLLLTSYLSITLRKMRGSEPRKKQGPTTSGHWTRPTVATRLTLCTTASSPARTRTGPATALTVMPVLSTSKHHPQQHHHQQQRGWAQAQAQAHGDWDHYTLKAATTIVAINPSWGPAAEFHELFAVGVYGVPSLALHSYSISFLTTTQKQQIWTNSVAVQN